MSSREGKYTPALYRTSRLLVSTVCFCSLWLPLGSGGGQSCPTTTTTGHPYWLMIMQLQTYVAQATHLVSHLPVLAQLVKSVKAPQTKGGHLVSVDRAVLLRVVIPAPAQDHACLGRVLIKQAWWPQISAALCWPMLPPVFRPKSSPLQCVGQ